MELRKLANRVGLFAVLACISACDWGQSPEEHIANAYEFIADSDYPSAIIELKNALQSDTESAEARYLLGKTYLESGDVLSARKELERALQSGWPGSEVQPLLARTLLAQGEYAEVRELGKEGLTPAAKADLFATQAMAALALGDTWDAEKLVDDALALAPDSTEALLAKARILGSTDQLDAANAILDQIISREPGEARAWSLRGDILLTTQDFAGALAAYDQAIAGGQENYTDLFKRAMLNLQLGNFDAAQADTTALLARAPQHPGANYIQGILYYQAGSYSEAITALSVTESAFQQYPLSLFFLAGAQLVEGNMDQAASLAGRFHNLQPDNLQGRKLLATIRLQQGKYSTAQALLQPVLAADPDDVDALNLAANASLRDGKTNEGIELLSRVAALQPDSPGAQVRLGAGLLLGGKGEDATRHMENALALNPEFQQADILLVLNHLQKRDFPAAISAAQDYRRRNIASVTPYNLLGKVYQEAGQPDEARAAFERALVLDGADPAANHNLAKMAIADNDIPAARAYYQTVLAAQPDSSPTLVQLALLDAMEGDENALVANLEQAASAAPTALEPRLLLARYYVGKGRPEKVAPLFTNLDPLQQKSPAVLRILAMAQLSNKDPSAAQFTLEQLLASAPDSAQVHHMMAMAAEGAGDIKRVREELELAVALDENYVPSRIALARLALANQSTEEFERHLEKLEALAPQNPEVLLLQATAEAGRGNSETALRFATEAFERAPSTTTLITMANYQEAAGTPEAARNSYGEWLKEHPDDAAVNMAYANSLQIVERFADAEVQYVAALKVEPNNPIALNNLAWINREKNPARALEYARNASELAPKSPDILDTLAVVEYFNEDYERAQRSIERALKASPTNPSLLYHSAMIAAAQGDKAAARATLDKLLATGTNFPEIDDARALQSQLGN